jgi:hypothetical protein
MNIEEAIRQRGITEVLHFTTNRGLVGSLAKSALLSRRALPSDDYLEHVLHPNAHQRPEESAMFDKREDWLDFVNLSVSEINRRFFNVSERWHQDASVWWVILSFDAAIMTHRGVYFATTNNGYTLCNRAAGIEGFEKLFSSPVQRKPNWAVSRYSRPQTLPTCEQAEVLYPERVSIEYLRRIYVRTEDERDIVRGFMREFGLADVAVDLNPRKFLGNPN